MLVFIIIMAAKKQILFRLLSSAGTGYFYVGSKPSTYFFASFSQTLKKLTLRKYDPLVNQHVLFNEVKMPSGRKRT